MTVHVAVEGQLGLPDRSVPADAFSVSVDGVERPIESVRAADQPLSVIVLVDESGSMKWIADRIEAPARDFVERLGDKDRWRAGAFGDRITFSPEFTTGRSSFRLAPRDPIVVRERMVRGGSPLWDAVRQSVELLAGEPGRRMVVVFTDARASGNLHGAADVAEFTVDNTVSVSAIVPVPAYGIRQSRETIAVVTPAVNLDRLARYSGGVMLGGFEAKEQPLKLLATLATRLRAGYAVTFAVPDLDGRRHRLDVRVATKGLQVRAPMAFRAVRAAPAGG